MVSKYSTISHKAFIAHFCVLMNNDSLFKRWVVPDSKSRAYDERPVLGYTLYSLKFFFIASDGLGFLDIY